MVFNQKKILNMLSKKQIPIKRIHMSRPEDTQYTRTIGRIGMIWFLKLLHVSSFARHKIHIVQMSLNWSIWSLDNSIFFFPMWSKTSSVSGLYSKMICTRHANNLLSSMCKWKTLWEVAETWLLNAWPYYAFNFPCTYY